MHDTSPQTKSPKPKIACVPQGWSLTEDSYGEYVDGYYIDLGLIEYTNEANANLVQLRHGAVPSALMGWGDDKIALIQIASLRIRVLDYCIAIDTLLV